MPDYPSGTVAFLFTDIEGSTRRWETQPEAMWAAVERHTALLDDAIAAHYGVRFKIIGDAVQAAFPAASDAIAAAVAAQVALVQQDWRDVGSLRVRMAVHVGEATPSHGDYLAPALNRLARVIAAGHGEQVLLTEAARAAAGASLPPGCDLLDLGAHRLRDLLQAEHIYQLRGPGLAVDFPPLKSLDRSLHNLPAQPTALLGREADVGAVRALIEQDSARSVTLTGPGGTGKTRLALQIGAEMVEQYSDGVWFVPLAAITDPDLVIAAIAQPLGVREIAGESLLQSVQEFLRSRHTLLLLDNFEQVAAAAPVVSTLVQACPQLTVLTTSREALRISGEREVPVAPLSLPDPRQASRLPADALLAYPAVRLFVERAQAIKPDFALTAGNGVEIAAICQRLDGLPLAIELAAARVRVLPPAQLLSRLDQRLKVLTSGNRDLPARQQTLRAAIAWSHDLLAPDEQTLFARLAVFAGGCTLEAAETICEDADSPIEVFDGLDSLLQKSLLRQTEDAGEPRYGMLETIREYGQEQLDATPDGGAVREAHASYFLALVQEAEPELTGSQQIVWLDRLGAEHDNLRAALGWLERERKPAMQLQLAAGLWRFWWMRGHLREGREWLDRALAGAEEHSPDVLATALSGAGILAESQGAYARATDLHERALALWRQVGDESGIASSSTNLGIIARVLGDNARAKEFHEQAFAVWQEIGDERGMTGSLYELGLLALNRGDYPLAARLLNQSQILAQRSGERSALGSVLESLGILAFYQADYARATEMYETSLTVWRELDDSRMIAHALANLGEVAQAQGDMERAEGCFREASERFQELGEQRGTAFVLAQLGWLAMTRDNASAASAHFAQSLALRWHVGDKPATVESLEGMAMAAAMQGKPVQAAQLFGAAEALRLAIDVHRPAVTDSARERVLAEMRSSLGEDALRDAWEQGRSQPIDQAIAEATKLARHASVEQALLTPVP